MAEIDEAVAAYERGDYGAARNAFERATAAGDSTAARYLGFMYHFGHGVKQSDRQAITYFRRAADAGDVKAQVNLARLYAAGRGIKQNYSAAAAWYRRAAEQGDAGAMTRLALLRHDGLDSVADLSEAAVWFRRAAELGDTQAQAMVAHLYTEGRGVERNPVEALIWANLAATSNNEIATLRDRLAGELPEKVQAEAYYRLALKLQAEKQATVDEARVMENFKLAAELGHLQAMRRLALCYFDGRGLARDWAAAALWLRRAAEAGSMESGLAYAAMLFAGEGTARDPAAALPWARRAVEAGLADAPRLLAAIERALAATALAPDPLTPRPGSSPIAQVRRTDAPGDPAPASVASVLFDETAAKKNAEPVVHPNPADALGQTALGLDYYFGRNGYPRDRATAAKWLQRAANGGSLAAQHNLSVMYAHGQGLRLDPAEGARWCRIAAERGDRRSQFRMSYLYFHGRGVSQDALEALFWAELAARQGHRGALNARDGLAARMTPQQIAHVRHRAENFQPRS